MKLRLGRAFGVMIALAVQGFAIFVGDPLIPVDRLITNTTAYIREHPDDAMGPYTLARIHYLALASRASTVLGWWERSGLPTVNEPNERPSVSRANGWTEAELRDHLKQSVENYQKALKMDERNALFHLGLASVSGAALKAGFRLGPIPGAEAAEPPKDGDFTALWREQAIREYLKAYELSIGTNGTVSYGHIAHGLFFYLISHEAGQHYVELVTERGVRDSERETFVKIRSSLETLSGPLRGAITPVLFRLSEATPLDALLDPDTTVAFDLNGTRLPQRYTWVRPDTGILVWDPANEGRIVSGHQLFGSVTFQMFWPDGYRALDSLDDNRDGELRGGELKGLAVWFDRNQNGISDPGEVVSIEQTGISALSARATTRAGASLANEQGLRMNDGRTLPTYDWTTEPLPDISESRGLPRS